MLSWACAGRLCCAALIERLLIGRAAGAAACLQLAGGLAGWYGKAVLVTRLVGEWGAEAESVSVCQTYSR